MFGLSRILRLAVAVVVAEILARKANMPNDEKAAGAGSKSDTVALPIPGSTGSHNVLPQAVTAVSDASGAGGLLSEVHLIGGEVLKVALEAEQVLKLFGLL